MATTITLDRMSDTDSGHTAERVSTTGWRLSWLPTEIVTRDQAITGLMLAAAVAHGVVPGHPRWPHVKNWAAELGLSGLEALALVTVTPG